jgi:superfamily I DNA/RNA helicase
MLPTIAGTSAIRHPAQMAFVTFTNSAARVLRRRLREAIGEPGFVGTLHSMMLRQLRQAEPGIALISEEDADEFVDRHAKPGGHWNDAYPFVRLHQPSAFYGVNSLELGERRIDLSGPNQGLYELASGPEISAYFDRVLHQQLLPTGRVRYHPMCNHLGDGLFETVLVVDGAPAARFLQALVKAIEAIDLVVAA